MIKGLKYIALFSQDIEFIEFITILIEGKLPLEIKVFNDPQYFYDNSALVKSTFLIISDNDISSDPGDKIYQFNRDVYKLPFIYILNDTNQHTKDFFDQHFKEYKQNYALTKDKVAQKIILMIDQISKYLDAHIDEGSVIEDYDGKKLYRIKTSYFLDKGTVSADVFIKLPTGKFLKLMKENDEVNIETLKNIIKKGQHYVYQDSQAYERFLDTKFDNLKRGLKNKNLKNSTKMILQLKSIKQVQDAVRIMGVSEQVISVTDEVVSSVEDIIKSGSGLKSLVKTLLSTKSTFFTRASIRNYILGGIASKIGWDTQSTLKKLIFASVFCDFSFTEGQDELSMVLTLEDPKVSTLSKFEKEVLIKHPEMAASNFEKSIRGMAIDEVRIIAQHHEKPDGSGFPSGLSNKTLTPVVCLFILAYDFTNYLVQSAQSMDDLNAKQVLEDMDISYQQGNFEKPYYALRKALKIDLV